MLLTLAKRLGEIGDPPEAVTILVKLTTAHPEEESYREFLDNARWQVFEASKDEGSKQAAIASWRQLTPGTTKDANRVSRVADIFRRPHSVRDNQASSATQECHLRLSNDLIPSSRTSRPSRVFSTTSGRK